MTGSKYIIVDTDRWCMVPFVFVNHIQHDEMARMVGVKKEDVVSAAFVYHDDAGNMILNGKSTSLGIGIGEHDEKILSRMFEAR